MSLMSIGVIAVLITFFLMVVALFVIGMVFVFTRRKKNRASIF